MAILRIYDGEKWIPIPAIKGEQGEQGKQGERGRDGEQGIQGEKGVGISEMKFNDAGELFVTYTDERSVNIGKAAGIITKTEINDNGELVITYSDNKTETLGRVVGKDGDTPYIGENGNWYIDDTDTEVRAEGNSGVYVGTGEMPDNCNVQIDPSGEETIALPNPHALTFTGATTGSYDGSTPLTINIPDGNKITDIQSNADGSLTFVVKEFTEDGLVHVTEYKTKSLKGADGNDGAGIESIVVNDDYSLTITTEEVRNGNIIVTPRVTYTTPSLKGEQGVQGTPGENGADGADGETPYIKDGNWWIGDTDTGVKSQGADGKDGVNGVDGQDGESVTVYSVTESTEDGGENVVIFSDGKTLTVRNGKQGEKGADGAKGDKGDTGAQGEQGETGAQGEAGKDGVSVTHSWNGTTLTVTSASGTSSADLKGDRGEQGIQGVPGEKGDTGEQGIQGKQGESGVYVGSGTPPTGTKVQVNPDGESIEILTAEETRSIITEMLADKAQLTPEYADSFEELEASGDTSKLYVLPDGYIYAYAKRQGVSYTNQLPIAKDTDLTTVYNGVGYITDKYISSGNVNNKAGYNTTGLMPIGMGSTTTANGEQVIRLENIEALPTDAYVRVAFYKADGSFIQQQGANAFKESGDDTASTVLYSLDENGYIEEIDVTRYTAYLRNAGTGETAYFRLCAPGIDGDSIITVNEPMELITTVPNFTNQIPISKDADGSVYNGKGYIENTKISSSGGGNTTMSGYGATGYIPFGYGSAKGVRGEWMVYFSNIDSILGDNDTRVVSYNSSYEIISTSTGAHYVLPEDDTQGYDSIATVDENNTITSVDMTGPTASFKLESSKETAFIRVCAKGLDETSIVTVNEPITYTIIENGSDYAWVNTGHAFVSADYEPRIVALEEDNEKIKARLESLEDGIDTENSTPSYIIAEAERVAKNVQTTRTAKSLVFPMLSDMHLYDGNSTHTNSLISAQCAGMGIDELNKLMRLDFIGYLGDYSWMSASENYTVEQVKADITLFKKTTCNADKEVWCVGNHDLNYAATRDRLLTPDELYSHIGANSDGVKPYASIERGYGYIDFDNQKIRVIYLNTCDVSDWIATDGKAASSEWISPTQIQWLADTALNFSGKAAPSEWGIVIVGHHPLHYPLGCYGYVMTILEAYRDGLSGRLSCTIRKDTAEDGTVTHPQQEVIYDFSTVDRAEIICNIHGHNHNFGYSKISSTTWKEHTDGVNPLTPWLWRFCIPNICGSRENSGYENFSYNTILQQNFGEIDENGNPVYWRKETGTAKATSFCVVNIDRSNRKIHIHVFGAGTDRVISY